MSPVGDSAVVHIHSYAGGTVPRDVQLRPMSAPWNSKTYAWNHDTVVASAPSMSGVYAIWNHNQCVYVGETQDLQRRLLAHLQGDNPCIAKSQPTAFSFEAVPAGLRGTRQSALIFQLRPVCS